MKNEAGTEDEPDKKVCLDRTKITLEEVKQEYAEVEVILRKFFREPAEQ